MRRGTGKANPDLAGFIDNDDLEKVRAASDVVTVIGDAVPLKQRGREFWCCCPFHDEKTPSMQVRPDRQDWHCFGCGEGGDVFSFVMKLEGLNFPEAVRKLAERAHIDIKESGGRPSVTQSEKSRLKEVCKETAEYYHMQLMRGKSQGAASARSYLSSRNLGGDIPAKWKLGFAPSGTHLVHHLKSLGFTDDEIVGANVAVRGGYGLKDRFYDRIMFPIADAQGDIIAFGGRVIGTGEPKYLNTGKTKLFNKSQVLYGFDKAKTAMTATGTAIVVEGYTDVIALHNAGVANAAATLGTALTIQHIRAISRFAGKRIVYLFDGDEAGQKAADKALAFIDDSMTPEAGKTRVELCAVTLPDNLDPAEFVETHGKEALDALIAQATPLISYGIERRLARFDLSSAEGRSGALTAALEILAPIKDSLLAKDYAVQIAGRVHAREQDVLDRLSALTPPKRYPEESGPDAPKAAIPQERPRTASLPVTEVNRRNVEREFIGLIAANPAFGLVFADRVASTNWHEPLHGRMADTLLDLLSEKENVTTAEIIGRMRDVDPRTPSILTSVSRLMDVPVEEQLRFLSEELWLGDMEEVIADLTRSLQELPSRDDESASALFAQIAALRKDVALRKANHKPSL